ncbi:MAG TPA: hypothetical protein VMZ73_01355 [Acidimicrobiales bacterium]|nr:hypothetical protein [Acidimicrobiales bacterium]
MGEGGASEDLPESLRLQAFAALARRLEADHEELVKFLVDTLARALPGAVTVHRSGRLRSRRVSSVEVLLGQRQYELHVHHGRLDTVLAQVVGGVVLRHDPVPVEAWVEGLLGDLERTARQSDATRAALERLVR